MPAHLSTEPTSDAPPTLTDDQWAAIAPWVEPATFVGRPRSDLRPIVAAIHHRWRTGCPWRQLPAEFPRWCTVYYHYRHWTTDGTIARLKKVLGGPQTTRAPKRRAPPPPPKLHPDRAPRIDPRRSHRTTGTPDRRVLTAPRAGRIIGFDLPEPARHLLESIRSVPADPTPTRRPGTPPDPAAAGAAFRKLCEVVARLRAPDGCPWDRQQTLATIKPYTLEETYELLDAIDSGDDEAIVEELGDVLLQVVLDAQIGADEGRFDLVPVIDRLTDKLVRRHPHVFGDATAQTAADVTPLWDKAKHAEKRRDSVFDGLPAHLPQLARAAKITARAAKAGYDFPHRAMLFDKLREEIAELADELFENGAVPDMPATVNATVVPDEPVADPATRARIESEVGDILFVVANIARRWGVNPEEALRASNRKFTDRVRFIETELAKSGRRLADATLAEQEAIYQRKKRLERGEEPTNHANGHE
jgi:MazG family protein